MTEHLIHVQHPLVQHKLSIMRDKATSTAQFRQLLREISQLLAYEITRNLPMTTRSIETPMQTMDDLRTKSPGQLRTGMCSNLDRRMPSGLRHSDGKPCGPALPLHVLLTT